ncbi:hypothetical protein JXA48_05235 [Candidatus Woesearchaeota archaeon]|nr:hypothetical protein [Candidatus Woesearchaeota archaeon]
MGVISAFLLGLVASFTPCVIILLPALVYRFSGENFSWKAIAGFTGVFVTVFFIIAQFFSYLFSSSIKFGFHLGIGIFFIFLGVLALMNKINPLNFPVIKNPYLFGLIFALIVAANPCSFAYLGVILASGGFMVFDLIAFSLALLVPALLFAIFGNSLLKYTKKTAKLTEGISYLMNLLLIAMGVYLIFKIKMFGFGDSIAAAILILLSFYVLLKSTFFFSHKIDWKRVLLLIALIGILVASIIHCNYYTRMQVDEQLEYNYLNGYVAQPTCSDDVMDCETCTRCIVVFGITAMIGGLGIFLISRSKQKIN